MKNTCTPSNIYGPIRQHLFLGCSVKEFSCSAGFNEQIGELSVILVEDTCSSVEGKIYYDELLRQRVWNGPDPGFYCYNGKAAPVNAPVYFRVENFEFSGLIQSYEYQDTPDGRTYLVKLVDPRQILEGTQLIIGNYGGPVYNNYNLLNVYAFMESMVQNCLMSPSGGYGGSLTNSEGMPWNMIKTAVSILTASVPRQNNTYSTYGRLVGKGSRYGGFGLMKYDPPQDVTIPQRFATNGNDYHDGFLSHYMVDISDLPTAPNFWRLGGTNISLMEAITSICSDAGCDFYVDFLPTRNGGRIDKVIKIRTVSRRIQPRLDVIQNLLSTTSSSNSSSGVEGRNEVTTSFLVGGNLTALYQIPQYGDGTGNSNIVPYWGVYDDGSAIPTFMYNGQFAFMAPVRALNLQLTAAITPINIDTIRITEGDLLTALAGFDSWVSWADTTDSPLMSEFKNRGRRGAYNVKGVLDLISSAVPLIMADFVRGNGSIVGGPDGALVEDVEKDLQIVYDFVLSYAREYYGKQFLVRIPYTCFKFDDQNYRLMTSEVPTDGGWSDEPFILNMINPSPAVDFFSLEDGRVGPIVAIDDASLCEWEELENNEYATVGDAALVKATVENDSVVILNGTPRAIVTIPSAITDKKVDTGNGLPQFLRGLPAAYAFANGSGSLDDLASALKSIGNTSLDFGASYVPRMPTAVALPMRSTIQTYGPWYLPGPPGSVKFEQDESLVPWEYGDTSSMYLAGIYKVTEGLTGMQAAETGSVTIPGYPTKSLGGEIGADYTNGNHLIENRGAIPIIYNDIIYYVVDMGTWTGLFGPNITGISIDFGADGISTTYQMQTFTPKFGRFSRQNAERLKQLSLFSSQQQRAVRLYGLTAFQLGLKENARYQQGSPTKQKRIKNKRTKKGKNGGQAGSVPFVIVTGTAEYGTIGNTTTRPMSISAQLDEANANIIDNYQNKAMMSMDGFYRPVSLKGSGGLPRMYNSLGEGGSSTRPSKILPSTDVVVNNVYLNPLQGPSDPKHGTSAGHDINVIARGSELPERWTQNPKSSEYPSDYRFPAIKGPMILQQWGYDLDGKPVPNKADTEANARQGTFAKTGLQGEFLDNYLQKSHTWPVAPIDLRLDRDRGVWVSPIGPQILKVQLPLGMSGGSTTGIVLEGGPFYDNDGVVVNDPEVTVLASSSTDYDEGYPLNKLPENCVVLVSYDTTGYKIVEIVSPLELTVDTESFSGSDETITLFREEEELPFTAKNTFKLSSDGGKAKIFWDMLLGVWQVVGVGGATIKQFKLNETLSLGGTVEATITNSDEEVTVKDPTDGDGSFEGDEGFIGYFIPVTLPDPEDEELEIVENHIVWMESYADSIRCILTQDIQESGTTVGTIVGEGGRVPNSTPESPLLVYDTSRHFTTALEGAKCRAKRDRETKRYNIIECDTQAGWIIFKLNGTSGSLPNTHRATLVNYGGTQQDVQAPNLTDNTLDVYKPEDVEFKTEADAIGFAILDVTNKRYVITPSGDSGPGVFQFTLTGELSPGGSANATLPDLTEIIVEDYTSSAPKMRGAVGFKGWAVYDREGSEKPIYKIVYMEEYSEQIRCTLSENMGATTSNQASVTGVTGMGGRTPSISTVYDTDGLFKHALNGAKCVAVYDTTNNLYRVVECESKAGWVVFSAASEPSSDIFSANVISYGGSQQDVQNPGSVVSITIPSDYTLTVKVGQRGYAVLGSDGIYRAVSVVGDKEVIPFILTEPLTIGGSAGAETLPDETVITVEDPTENSFEGDTGFVGFATIVGTGNPQIIWMEGYSDTIRGVLTENMGDTLAGQATCGSVVGEGGNTPTVTIVYDVLENFKFALTGAKFRAKRNKTTGRYEIIQCETTAGWIISTLDGTTNSGRFRGSVDLYGGTQQDIQEPRKTDNKLEIVRPGTYVDVPIISGTKIMALFDARTGYYTMGGPFGSITRMGTTASSIPKGLSGSVSITGTNPSGSVTAFSRMGDVSSGKIVTMSFINGVWEIVGAEC